MPLSYRNRAKILDKYPELAEALDDVVGNVESVMTQTNSSPVGQTSPPVQPSALHVTAAQGIFDAAITDNSPVSRGINYFLEYSHDPAFSNPVTVDLGQARNFRGHLGNQTLYWRAHSSYPTSPRSQAIYHGTQIAPIAVRGGGSISGPTPLAGQGSGTSNGGSGSDGAFGNNPYRRVRPVNS